MKFVIEHNHKYADGEEVITDLFLQRLRFLLIHTGCTESIEQTHI